MLDKIKRLKETLATETDAEAIQTIKGVISGMANFHLGINNDLAEKRYVESCKDCEFNVEEPIGTMAVKDKAVPMLSNRMCSHCGGCVLSYKLRQNKKICEFWK